MKAAALVLLGLGIAAACPFDDTLREYLDVHFWLPFSKHAQSFERKNVRRVSAPYAGMAGQDQTPLGKLRVAYQQISQPSSESFDPAPLRQAVAEARAVPSLTLQEREEVDLIDAKIDMRAGGPDGRDESLRSAQRKLRAFLRAARTPALLSEARGWLAYTYYLTGDQTRAGKIYLDELNRDGSNLSRETLLSSLAMTYRYDGGPELLEHLDEYFDTPEHAAFAIQLATNPRWDRNEPRVDKRVDVTSQSYARIKALLESHAGLFKRATGSQALALLSMRTALRMGDPPAALKIGEMVPTGDAVRSDPDFMWMLASAHFLSREYAAAGQPLLDLFQSSRSTPGQKAAAAYGLCGVYQKTGNPVEQIRFALWLQAADRKDMEGYSGIPEGEDQSVYWAVSGWDLNMLLDAEAPLDALRTLLDKYPGVPDARLVRYSLAVRLARENRYEEAAQIYQSIHAGRRAARMRQLATLYQEAARPGALEAKYKLAEFISANPDRIYFNDALWHGYQRYALAAEADSRFTREERTAQMDRERKLKDDQEERWRAYLILRDVVRDAGNTDLARKSALLAIRCLGGISERFGRLDDLRKANAEMSAALRPSH